MIDDLFEQLAQPLLSQYLGTAVMHYPLGVLADAASVDVVIATRETREQTDQGLRTQFRLIIDVPETVTVRPADQWQINGQVYNTDRDGIGLVAGGFRQVAVTRPQIKTNTLPGRPVTA